MESIMGVTAGVTRYVIKLIMSDNTTTSFQKLRKLSTIDYIDSSLVTILTFSIDESRAVDVRSS